MQDKAAPGSATVTLQRLCEAEAPTTGFHVALDTMEARRLRDCPDKVRIEGFVLLDTGSYEPVTAMLPLELFWRMQGMDILAHTRSANCERRARPRKLPVSGSVWLVDATLEGSFPKAGDGGLPVLHIAAVHALDRVSLEPRGPRFIERIDTQTMLPRFAAQEA